MTLVAGLGNQSITPDAIGPLCAQRVFATRHIRQLGNELDMGELTEVSVIRPGVLGQTGIEASDLVKAACSRIDADTVIAVDALACSETHNLGRTIQLTDTGISPGSGVANSRKELSRRTLGADCIAVGIPTVTDHGSGRRGYDGHSERHGPTREKRRRVYRYGDKSCPSAFAFL